MSITEKKEPTLELHSKYDASSAEITILYRLVEFTRFAVEPGV